MQGTPHRLPPAPSSAPCTLPGVLPCAAEVDVEASYLLEDGAAGVGSGGGSGAPSRMSRLHSRVPSAGSAASWDSSLPTHSHSSSRTGLALDAQGAYVEASVGRMLSAGRDRWGWAATPPGWLQGWLQGWLHGCPRMPAASLWLVLQGRLGASWNRGAPPRL